MRCGTHIVDSELSCTTAAFPVSSPLVSSLYFLALTRYPRLFSLPPEVGNPCRYCIWLMKAALGKTRHRLLSSFPFLPISSLASFRPFSTRLGQCVRVFPPLTHPSGYVTPLGSAAGKPKATQNKDAIATSVRLLLRCVVCCVVWTIIRFSAAVVGIHYACRVHTHAHEQMQQMATEEEEKKKQPHPFNTPWDGYFSARYGVCFGQG